MGIKYQWLIKCINCGKDVISASPTRKYCDYCSEMADLIRKKLWAKSNPAKLNATAKRDREKTAPYRSVVGKIRSQNVSHGTISWIGREDILPIEVDQLLRFSVPFTHQYSKNAIYSLRGRGHIYIRNEVNQLRKDLIEKIKASGVNWHVNKVYLDILVQKPNMRGDAINVIDTIADAIKVGIGLDDNWFAIRRLDWEIVKDNPKIYIGIGQKNIDEYPCSYCGIFQTLDYFSKDRSARFGIGSECKSCLKEARKLKNAQK